VEEAVRYYTEGLLDDKLLGQVTGLVWREVWK
ncbi:MAG: hypothetical protein G01um101416_1223, partial [Microgenomates group bacterium Gr01-1014_16]